MRGRALVPQRLAVLFEGWGGGSAGPSSSIDRRKGTQTFRDNSMLIVCEAEVSPGQQRRLTPVFIYLLAAVRQCEDPSECSLAVRKHGHKYPLQP